MGAHLHAEAFGQPHRAAHHHRIGGMKAAGDVGDRDERHDAFVVTHLVEAVGLAHVAVDFPRHDLPRNLTGARLPPRNSAQTG
jgi:hypothetical protein